MRFFLPLLAAALAIVLLLAWSWLAAPVPDRAANAPSLVGGAVRASASSAIAPERGPERSEAIAPAATFRIVVVDAARRPIVGAVVLAWCEGDFAVAEHATDADGAIVVPAREANGGLVAIAGDGAFGVAHPVAWRGEHTQVLSDGAALTGVVLVAGQPAPAGLRLRLTTTDFGLPASAPNALRTRLAALAGERRIVTAAAGTFAAKGLPAGWHGTLEAPAGHWFVAADAGVRTPRWLRSLSPGHLVVDLVRLPSVRGVARWTDGTRVTHGSIGVQAEMAGGTNVGGDAAIDPDGRFVVGLAPGIVGEEDAWMRAPSYPAFVRGTLWCGGVPGLVETVEIPLGANALVDEVEVVLTLAPRVHFVVFDSVGAPIAGARVSVDGSEPTDAAGRSFYRGKPPRLVGAPRHAVVPATPVGGDGNEASPFRFVLPPRNELAIEVVTAHGPAPAGLEVELQTGALLFAGRQSWWPLHGAFGGSEGQCGEDAQRRYRVSATTDVRGRIAFHSLEPGTVGRVAVFDRLGSELGQAEFESPAFGGSAMVAVRLDAELVRVRGQVVRADGVPLAGAEVWLHGPGPRGAIVWADADGRFEARCRRLPEPTDLRVQLPGYALERRRDVLRGDGDLGVIQLLAGRTITVRVVDEAGAPVDLFAQPAGHEPVQQQNLGGGVWRWPDMPNEVVFYAQVSGRRFEAFAGPGVDEVVLRATQVARVWAPAAPLPAEVGVEPHAACILLHRADDRAPWTGRLLFGNEGFGLSVLPGRYRAELARIEHAADGSWHPVPLGITRDLELSAGQTVAIRF